MCRAVLRTSNTKKKVKREKDKEKKIVGSITS